MAKSSGRRKRRRHGYEIDAQLFADEYVAILDEIDREFRIGLALSFASAPPEKRPDALTARMKAEINAGVEEQLGQQSKFLSDSQLEARCREARELLEREGNEIRPKARGKRGPRQASVLGRLRIVEAEMREAGTASELKAVRARSLTAAVDRLAKLQPQLLDAATFEERSQVWDAIARARTSWPTGRASRLIADGLAKAGKRMREVARGPARGQKLRRFAAIRCVLALRAPLENVRQLREGPPEWAKPGSKHLPPAGASLRVSWKVPGPK